MTVSQAGTTTRTVDIETTEQTERAYAAARVGTQTQQIASYLADDLLDLVRQAHVDIYRCLAIPSGVYMGRPAHVVELVCADIERMLRDRLIERVHLMFVERTVDPGTGRARAAYEAQYAINLPRSAPPGTLQREGDRLRPPPEVARGRDLVIVIDWRQSVTRAQLATVRRPPYWFSWITSRRNLDRSRLLYHPSGGLTLQSIRVVDRREGQPLDHE